MPLSDRWSKGENVHSSIGTKTTNEANRTDIIQTCPLYKHVYIMSVGFITQSQVDDLPCTYPFKIVV